MKLSFLPGELHLLEDQGTYLVQVKSKEMLRTRSKKKAVDFFNGLRRKMQQEFPEHNLTAEEIRILLEKEIADSLVGDHSVRKHKKSTAKSTRTFG